MNPTSLPQTPSAARGAEPLGEPMDIAGAAALLGCSVWTIRQRYLPQGLPHIRASVSGKFVFFRDQVIRWICERQKKGMK